MSSPAALQEQLEEDVQALRKLQSDYSKLVNNRSTYETQLHENKLAKEELALIPDGGNVFKLIGPALVKQDLVEARQNVDKRIDLINKEIERIDNLMKDIDGKIEATRTKAMKAQQALMQLQAKA